MMMASIFYDRYRNRLDLVISVDAYAAHLAGALAKSFWLLLSSHPIGGGHRHAKIAHGTR